MTGHVDTFANDSLPPKDLWPQISYGECVYPDTLNCAGELLDNAVMKGLGSKVVLYSPKEDLTYQQLLEQANRIAHVLTSDLQVQSGNRVLIHGPNTPRFAACWFGVLKAGGICVSTMPLLRSKELSYIVEKAKIEHVLCDASTAAEVLETVKQHPQLKVVFFNSSEQDSLEVRMHEKPSSFSNCQTKADDIALIAFTSGTTGKAKATMHQHRDVLAICDSFPRHTLKAQSSDVFCGTPPLAFTFGLGGLLLFPMRIGASSVFLEKAAPRDLLGAIEKYKITTLFTSPTGYRGLIDHLGDFSIKSLTRCVSAGENLPRATFDLWREKTGIKIIDGIGATEMLHIFISASGDEIRPGSTGKAVPGYEVCVMDEHGQVLPPGEVGLLAVRGPTGCRYLDDNERQQQYVRYGWNFTGDAYRMDEDGYFWFQARADDMIISSGYNISANEVENALLTHPAVKECGVVGTSDELRGQIVKAFVVLKDGISPEESTIKMLQDYVKAEIAPYKYPRNIEFVATLPRTETGKLQRFRLRVPEGH